MNDRPCKDEELHFARELNRQFELFGSANADQLADHEGDFSEAVALRVEKVKPVLQLLSQLREQRSSDDVGFESEPKALKLNRVGRFQIEREIGRGGNGIVFLANDDNLNRKVALKIPHVDGALSGSTRLRFEREARATAILSHPSIVSIYEFGHESGVYFIASQYIEGMNLADWIDVNGRPTPMQAAAIVSKLAEAIEHAHQRGVLHRDLKPSNVLVENSGDRDQPLLDRCHITDFGLAAIERSLEDLTVSNAMVGTPAYMSPEQTRGKHKQFSPATDVYGLGVILYQLLVGKSPFAGDDIAVVIQNVRKQDPVRPGKLSASVPKDLDAICLKCLEKSPTDRYESAFALQQDLQRFVDGNPVEARPVSSLVRLTRWMARYPQTASMLTAIIGLMLLLTIGSTIAAISILDSRREVVEHLAREKEANQKASENETRALKSLYLSKLATARALIHSEQQGQSCESLAALAEACELSDRLKLDNREVVEIRSLAATAASLYDVSLEQEYVNYGYDTKVAHNRNVSLYAISNCQKGQVEVRKTKDGSLVKTLSIADRFTLITSVKFDNAEKYLAVSYRVSSSKGRLVIWELERADAKPIVSLESDVFAEFDFFPDSRRLAFVRPDSKLVLVDLENGQSEVTGFDGLRNIECASHQDRLVAATKTELIILECQPGRTSSIVSSTISGEIYDLQWSRDDSMLAVGLSNGLAKVFNADDLTLIQDFDGHGWHVRRVGFHPNGKLLATYSDRISRVWDVETGQQVLFSDKFQFDRFDVSGKWIGAAKGRLKFWGGDLRKVIKSEQNTELGLSIHPGGRVLSICRDGRLELVDLVSGKQLFQCFLPYARACFSPDGKQLYIASALGVFELEVNVKRQGNNELMSISSPSRLSSENLGRGSVVADPHNAHLAVTVRYPVRGGAAKTSLLDRRIGTWRSIDRQPSCARWQSFSPDGDLLAIGTWHGLPKVTIWDTKTGRCVKNLPHKNAQLTFSPDGNTLVVDDGAGAFLYRCADWQLLAQRGKDSENAPMPIAISPDSQLIAVLSNRRTVEVLRLKTFESLFSLAVDDDKFIEAILFSPDGQKLIAGAANRVFAWDLSRFEIICNRLGIESGIDATNDAVAPNSTSTPGSIFVEANLGDLKALSIEYEVSSAIERVSAFALVRLQATRMTSKYEAATNFVNAVRRIDCARMPSEFRMKFEKFVDFCEKEAKYSRRGSQGFSELTDRIDEELLERIELQKREAWEACLAIQFELRAALKNEIQ